MDLNPEQLQSRSDFLRSSFLRLAVVALVFITPFAIHNLVIGQYLIGMVCCGILTIFSLNARSIVRHNCYRIVVTQFLLIPTILFLLVLLFSRGEMIGVFWCYPAAGSFHFMLPRKRAWAATLLLFAIVTPLIADFVPLTLGIRIMATLAMVSVAAAVFVRVMGEQQYRLRLLAMTDPLTGVLNRMLLHETLAGAIEQSRCSELPMTLVALDIDHFKVVNDTFGHDVGDQVLRGVSQLLRSQVRPVDRVFRLGGEEFLVLLHGMDGADERCVAEDLRRRIAGLALLPERSVTVSVGVATLQAGEDWSAWMKRSDKKLYRAKMGGRNRVEV